VKILKCYSNIFKNNVLTKNCGFCFQKVFKVFIKKMKIKYENYMLCKIKSFFFQQQNYKIIFSHSCL